MSKPSITYDPMYRDELKGVTINTPELPLLNTIININITK